ncbi:MAG: NAD(P)H-hydrate dehydratase [Thermoleophilia bacterium]
MHDRPLYTAAQMRQADAAAIGVTGIPGAVLMERAGLGAAEFILEHFCAHHCFIILAGKGNNGGDGFVVARHLLDSGASVRVFAAGAPGQYRGDAGANLKILEKMGGEVSHKPARAALNRALTSDCVIVDAIFGTGFSGEPRATEAQFIEAAALAAERFGNPVVALDIASGVDASTGEISRLTLPADATVTFHGAKVGHFVEPGSYFCGDLMLVDIGIPAGAGIVPDHFLTQGGTVAELIPPKMEYDNKFSVGRVLLAGGSTGLTGAACLAAEAALRAGAGVVTTAIPATLNPIFEQKLLEVMTLPVADTGDGHLHDGALAALLDAATAADCLALGPGLGRQTASATLVKKLLTRASVPMVLDADGLHALNGKPGLLKKRPAATVLTPHLGELGRLLGLPADEIAAHRLKYAKLAAKRTGAIMVLKGSATIITDGSQTFINDSGNPGLATAGAGDVLTGVIAALLAKGIDPLEAAAAGVFLHGAAADLAAADANPDNLIASDLIEYLPLAFAGLYGDPGESREESHH